LHSRCTHHIPQRSSLCHRTTAPEERLCCNIHQSYLRHDLPFFLLNTHCLRRTSRVAPGISHSRPQTRSYGLVPVSWGATKPHRFSSAIHKNCITGTSLKIVPRLRFNFSIALQTERSISSDFLLLLHHRPPLLN